jgi:IS605 OrfB family transposase
MKIVKTAKLKITSSNTIFNDTITIYNQALSFYIKIVNKEYKHLEQFKYDKEKLNYIESITHRTTKNDNIKYDFGIDFHKYPSYFRRATIMDALGVCSSHFSRLKNYNEKKEKYKLKNKKFHEKPPTLNFTPNEFPSFYKDNMFLNKETINSGKGKIKIYKNNDWVWQDIEYSTKNLYSGKEFRFKDYKQQNPKLVKKGKKYFLHIPFKASISLNSTSLKKQRVIGVDLGLTNSAVCSCIDYNGTVIDRLFINQSKEKDQMRKRLNKLSKAKRISGTLNEKPNHWRRINNLQKYIVKNTATEIVKFAIKNNADVIVFEYLGKMKLPKGSFGAKKLRAKLQYWAKCKIQNITCKIAHSKGIRYSRVLARGTSMYAFDGSGKVERNNKKDIAKFQNGKKYHSDLSASYNIGSRYFIRAILKPLSEKARLQYEAKVPSIANRTSHTLSTLISLQEVA